MHEALPVLEPARLRFARLLKSARLSRSISQEALAGICGLHRTYVGSVERGERNIAVDNMEALAKALDLDISDLLLPPQYDWTRLVQE